MLFPGLKPWAIVIRPWRDSLDVAFYVFLLAFLISPSPTW